jgi:O-antigen ligase
VLCVVDLVAGLAATIAVIVLLACIEWPQPILVVLVATAYAQWITIGGTPVGRLAAPVAVLAAVSVWVDPRHTSRAHAPAIRLAAATYVTVAIASVAWTRDLDASIFGIGSLAVAIAYFVAIAALTRTDREISTLTGSIVVSAVVVGVLWIAGFAAGVSRFASDVGDPNFVAMQQAMAVPVAISVAGHARTRGARTAAWFAVPLIVVSVAASLSRGGILALLAVLSVVLFQRRRSLFASRSHERLLVGALIAGSAIAVVATGNDLIGRLATTESAASIDASREGLARAALRAYTDAPITGIGYGAFAPASYRYLRDTPGVDLAAYTPEALIEGREVHNAYVQALAELGPIGAVAFVSVALAGIVTCRSVWRSAGAEHVRSYAAALAAGLVAFLIGSLTLSTQTTRSLWIWLGAAYALTRFAPRPLRPRSAELESLTVRRSSDEHERDAEQRADGRRDQERPHRTW